MKKQVEQTIEASEKQISVSVSSPSAISLLMINDDAEKLDEKRKEIFHTVTWKLLYLEKRVRPDIELAVSF